MALGPMFQSLKDLLIFKFWLKFYKTKQTKATTIKASCRTSNYFWYLNVSLGSWVGHFCSGGLKSGFTSRRIIGICPLSQRIWRLGKEQYIPTHILASKLKWEIRFLRSPQFSGDLPKQSKRDMYRSCG